MAEYGRTVKVSSLDRVNLWYACRMSAEHYDALAENADNDVRRAKFEGEAAYYRRLGEAIDGAGVIEVVYAADGKMIEGSLIDPQTTEAQPCDTSN